MQNITGISLKGANISSIAALPGWYTAETDGDPAAPVRHTAGRAPAVFRGRAPFDPLSQKKTDTALAPEKRRIRVGNFPVKKTMVEGSCQYRDGNNTLWLKMPAGFVMPPGKTNEPNAAV